MIKKTRLIAILCAAVFTVLIAAVSSCFSPYTGEGPGAGGADVVIIAGGGMARGAVVLYREDTARISHTVTMSGGPGPSQSATVMGETPATFTVTPGQWDITVEGYMGGGLIASGGKSVEIKAGANTVGIDMVTIDGGSGTLNDPWIIYSEELLRKVGTDDEAGWGLDDHYKLLGDITLTGGLWTPVGKSDYAGNTGYYSDPFTGSFDGNGKTITGLTINYVRDPLGRTIAQGMFSLVGGDDGSGEFKGEVKNLRLENASVTNNNSGDGYRTGGIAGDNRGTIRDCTVSGDIKGQYAGAIAGSNGGVIINCAAEGGVSDGGYYSRGGTGGIAGSNDGDIQNCYAGNIITVTGSDYAGGIAGENGGVIQNCYAGNIITATGSDYAGGIAGYNSNVIQNCYAENVITADGGGYAGGIAGYNGSVIQNCAALSPNIAVTDTATTEVGRICALYDGFLGGNWGRGDMTVNGGPYTWQNQLYDLYGDGSEMLEGIDGTDVAAGDYGNPVWWGTPANWSTADLSGDNVYPGTPWDFTAVWDWDSAAGRPVLRAVRP